MAITVRFYEELNEFLPRQNRKKDIVVKGGEARSVKDMIESLGVPHTEVDLVLVDGVSVAFDYLIRDDVRVSVYPKFESFDISALSKVPQAPLRVSRFIADVHLGKLTRRLRLLGFDCVYDIELDDAELARRASGEDRILLTRDRGLLKRAEVTHGIFVQSDDVDTQIKQVLTRLDLKNEVQPFARCIECNGLLNAVDKGEVADKVPARTYRYYQHFMECASCGKVYWKGTHWNRIRSIIADALGEDAAVEWNL